MDLLFRLSKDINGFSSIEETKLFFLNILPQRDKNYFFHTKKISQMDSGDTIYFAYDGYIVAKAIFGGQIITDKERDKYFIEGHKVKNIQIINSSIKLDTSIIKGRGMRYIKTKEIQNEIQRVLNETYEKIVYPDDIDENNFTEGSKKQVIVNAYERNPKARQECIKYYGTKCFICGFDFEKKYGEIGRGFIHVHHIKPLSEINEKYEVNPIQDLRPVCPNCHAMIHKQKPAYSIEEIQSLLVKKTYNESLERNIWPYGSNISQLNR